jgi:hypothetical protein
MNPENLLRDLLPEGRGSGAEFSPMSSVARKGRILRIKPGYNPNSSSIGTIVFALPVSLLLKTTVFGVMAASLLAALTRPKSPRPGEDRRESSGDAEGALGDRDGGSEADEPCGS